MASIFQNPYIVSVFTFILAYIGLYCFNVGVTMIEKNGRIIKRPGWKYPLAITVLVWSFWALYLYPIDLSLGSSTTETVKIEPSNVNLNQWF